LIDGFPVVKVNAVHDDRGGTSKKTKNTLLLQTLILRVEKFKVIGDKVLWPSG
jgi:hypothetical protein